MTTGEIFSLVVVTNWFSLCSELPEALFSGAGENDKAV
jgi:hypothetical protein